jgi:hypothetical protein
MNAPLTITANLLDDLRAILLARLLADGVSIPQAARADCASVVEHYMTVLRRTVAPRPRRVHVAKQLYVHSACQKAYGLMVERIKNSIDLKPFLSKGILRPRSPDSLLYDWDIHHLHLAEQQGAGAFSPRSDYVLMVRFTAEDAYLIQILHHPSGPGWSRCDLLNRLHDEFPDSIRSFRFGEKDADDEPTTDDFVAKLREININYRFVTHDLVGYISPGGGTMKSWLSHDARMMADAIMNKLQQLQERYLARPSVLQNLARKHARTMTGSGQLKLEMDADDSLWLRWEGPPNIRFAIGQLSDAWRRRSPPKLAPHTRVVGPKP